MIGSLQVLNVGMGDIEITFDRHSAEDRDRALRMLKDMEQRGYAILVKLEDGTYTRALKIDLNRGAYVIGLPGETLEGEGKVAAPPPLKRGRKPKTTRVPIESAHAVGVARSAGG